MKVTLEARDIDVISGYLARTAGLIFDDSRRSGLTGIVESRIEAAGCSSAAAYATLVASPGGADERQALIDAVTIQETFFFRNGPQMQALRREVLPELIRLAARERRPLRVWSAGCSTGEEPYSLAMLVLEVMEELGLQIPVTILGTDVSSVAIERAKEGNYRGRTLDLADGQLADRWFVDQPDGSRTVHPLVRDQVEFRLHNLIADPPPFEPGEADLVVCRNVTIYFAKPTTAAVIASFHRTLVSHGVLLLGHAETLWQVSNDFDLVPMGEAFVYRRSSRGTGARPPSRRTRVGTESTRWAPRRRAGTTTSKRDDVTVVVPTPRAVAPTVVLPTRSTEPARVNQVAVRAVAAAEQALADGRYRDAYESAREAAIADALAVAAYAIAGRAAVAVGDDEAAIGPLRKAVFLEPGCAEAHFTLAGVLARDGQHRAAAAAYRAAGQAVATTSDVRLARMLDGRDPASLVDLCERLAESAEQADLTTSNGEASAVAGGA